VAFAGKMVRFSANAAKTDCMRTNKPGGVPDNISVPRWRPKLYAMYAIIATGECALNGGTNSFTLDLQRDVELASCIDVDLRA
jgi:hypothetical protein